MNLLSNESKTIGTRVLLQALLLAPIALVLAYLTDHSAWLVAGALLLVRLYFGLGDETVNFLGWRLGGRKRQIRENLDYFREIALPKPDRATTFEGHLANLERAVVDRSPIAPRLWFFKTQFELGWHHGVLSRSRVLDAYEEAFREYQRESQASCARRQEATEAG